MKSLKFLSLCLSLFPKFFEFHVFFKRFKKKSMYGVIFFVSKISENSEYLNFWKFLSIIEFYNFGTLMRRQFLDFKRSVDRIFEISTKIISLLMSYRWERSVLATDAGSLILHGRSNSVNLSHFFVHKFPEPVSFSFSGVESCFIRVDDKSWPSKASI